MVPLLKLLVRCLCAYAGFAMRLLKLKSHFTVLHAILIIHNYVNIVYNN